ncbi:hypothetical protein OPT61_g8851 [Boeremia exigua]|uniref:Uncharacterized protein n=1 Tax=Boeremia exigua TaxID=749465 RepID=A0ACC2HWI8_9PLEO|nr:hypothetical protein OPT61_g8851 [Boeremia exigua]
MSDTYAHTLQIVFGVMGVLSTLITLSGLHYRDSLGSIVFRRYFRTPVRVADPETDPLTPTTGGVLSQPTVQCSRRATLPPSYDLSTRNVPARVPDASYSTQASTAVTEASVHTQVNNKADTLMDDDVDTPSLDPVHKQSA